MRRLFELIFKSSITEGLIPLLLKISTPTSTPTYYEHQILNPSLILGIFREGYLRRPRQRLNHSSAYRPPHSRIQEDINLFSHNSISHSFYLLV